MMESEEVDVRLEVPMYVSIWWVPFCRDGYEIDSIPLLISNNFIADSVETEI